MIESGDTVIFSSKIIPGNEKKLYKLHNQLVKNGIEVISEENEFVHVSGHPNREDLKDMYNWVKPKSVIPCSWRTQTYDRTYKFCKRNAGSIILFK